MNARDRLLQRLAGRRPPTDPDVAPVWERLDPAARDRLRRVATDPETARHLDDPRDRLVVDALAQDRSRRGRVDLVTPVLLGLLVLSTVWGFGRAVVPDRAGLFLALGLAGAVVATLVGWRRRAVVRAAAREVRRVLRERADGAG